MGQFDCSHSLALVTVFVCYYINIPNKMSIKYKLSLYVPWTNAHNNIQPGISKPWIYLRANSSLNQQNFDLQTTLCINVSCKPKKILNCKF